MSYLVKAHIFSGRPDPVWAISDEQAEALLASEGTAPDSLFAAREGGGMAMAVAPRGLGYRGISLIHADGEVPTERLLDAAALESDAREAFVQDSPGIEAKLLETGRELIPPEIRDVILESIAQRSAPPADDRTGCPPCAAYDAPDYDPARWNNNPTVLRNNNCYNYANDRITNTFAQPGRGSGQIYAAIDCEEVGAAAIRDGLQATSDFTGDTPGWYVALVIWPDVDYHWYRQDRNGCWSHKPGGTEARNYDNSGNAISDPRTCDRGPYTIFCTFMVTNEAVTID